jgi:SAM-dependent methyltransferase
MQKVMWAGFGQLEALTGSVAPRFVRLAGIEKGHDVLDVACGTGVAALSAARIGARVTGVDITPELVAQAKENAELMRLPATFLEGDAEALPVPDAAFDVVVSQFGHMFAPRPEVAIAEMLRALRPGGRIAFSSWPPDLFVGRTFALMGRYAPPPPPGVSPPVQWGDPAIVRERLGGAVKDVVFTFGTMFFPTLSPQHYRRFTETSLGPAVKLLQGLDASDPDKAAAVRREMEELCALYFEDNAVRQDFLITRATKI